MRIKGEYRDVLSRNGEVIVDTGWKSNDIVADYGRFLAALMKKDFNEERQVGIDYMAVGGGSENDEDFKTRVENFFDSSTPGDLLKPTSSDNWVWAKEIEADAAIKYLNPYLFSIGDGALEDKLNSDIIPEELKEMFRTKGIPLSDTATVKKTENKWVITDEEKKYLITKEGEKLNIYLRIKPEGEEVDTVTNRLRIEVTFGKNKPSEETFDFKEFALLGIDTADDTFNTEKLFFINYVDHGLITKDKSMKLERTIILTFPVEKGEVT
ncbi:MAG: hypothetical protein KAT65_18125 [Methanophagales archaeon]|nr:hypothetical protein [Methanophagales archaeon]